MMAATWARGLLWQSGPMMRNVSVYLMKAVCMFTVFEETIMSVSFSTGPSMLTTFYLEGENAFQVPLPFYKRIAPYLPERVAPAFHTAAYKDRKVNPLANVGGPKGKLDPAMGTGLSVGDLVVIPSFNHPQDAACKRIVGMAGDTILFDPRHAPEADHSLRWKSHANEKSTARSDVSMSRTNPRQLTEPRYVVVPPGHVWVGGDNLAASTDSRDFGPIPLGLIRARVIAKNWQWLENTMRPVRSAR